ncbi:hypothetical protein [Reinekea sp. G2M2-21]|uniref:hypothetical protein n=1 Tax=Reinekea sp. G2M2-21 TaxID=2788942 RepID=UPI0018AC8976|nr:hypothetical protein [Reinekea sp. G2M2-21]
MYIVTTSKRIHQITALIFVCLALLASFAIYRYYHNYSAQPQALMQHLLRVVNQSESLKIAEVDVESIRAEAQQITLRQLIDDLSKTGVPDPQASAQLLLPQASSFLTNDKQFLRWLTSYLQQREMPDELLNFEKTDLSRREIISNNECLVIEKKASGWQLVSLLGCQLLD